MMLDLVKLEQLRAIARSGNLTRAAEDMGITQPALSRTVGLLEHRFGFRIFDRGRSGVRLTREGELLMIEAEALLRQARTMEHNVQLYRRVEAGELALGIGPQIAGLLLPRIGTHLIKSRPGLRLKCTLDTVDKLLPELMDGPIELILCASNFVQPAPELLIEPIGTMELGILARAGHPLAGKPSPVMSDLDDFPFVSESVHPPRTFPTGQGGISCESPHILREIVLETDAVWFSPPGTVAREIAAGAIIVLPVADLPFRHVDIGTIRLARRQPSPAASAIAEFVGQCLQASGSR